MRRKSPSRATAASVKSAARRSSSPVARAKASMAKTAAKENVSEELPSFCTSFAQDNLLHCFQHFDTNNDRIIDRFELSKVLQAVDVGVWTDRRVDQIIQTIGRKMYGQIHYEEFLNWILEDSPRDATETLFMEFVQAFSKEAIESSVHPAATERQACGAEGLPATSNSESTVSAGGTCEADVWLASVDEAADDVFHVVLPLLSDKTRRSGANTFHCILESGLYLGGAHVSACELQSVGITHIVRILEDTTHFVLPEDEVQSIFSVQVADVQNSDLRPFFSGMRSFAAEALEHGGKVYVHCAQGRSRSCAMILSYLVSQEKMSLRSAWLHVLQRRDVHAINLGFLAQLVDLDEAVHGRQSLPFLSIFIAKTRWDSSVLRDKSRKFDVSEFLELWRDPTAITRDPTAGLAIVMLKTSMSTLRKFMAGSPEEEEGEAASSLEPLRTRCCTELCKLLHMLS